MARQAPPGASRRRSLGLCARHGRRGGCCARAGCWKPSSRGSAGWPAPACSAARRRPPLVYLEAGQGRLIVLLHGFTGAKENWLPLMRRLSRTHRVIAPDLPGWGESTRQRGADYGPIARRCERDRAVPRRAASARASRRAGGRPFDGRAVHSDCWPRAIRTLVGPHRADVLGRRAVRRERLRPRGDGRQQSLRGAHARRNCIATSASCSTTPPFVPWPADEAHGAHAVAKTWRFEQNVLDAHRPRPGSVRARRELGADPVAGAAAVVPRRPGDRRQRGGDFPRRPAQQPDGAARPAAGTCR